MAGRYGMSFAAKLVGEGKYDEAIGEADKLIAKVPDDPLPFVDRASAYECLERYADAVADYEKALTLEHEAQVLDIGVVDDSYFNALVSAAELLAKTDRSAGAKMLERYATHLPDGSHLDELGEWRQRLGG